MPKHYTVAAGQEFVYPADAMSLQKIRAAGGLSQMTKEDKSLLKFKTVLGGQDCSDMPEPALSLYLERGWVVEAESKKSPSKETSIEAPVTSTKGGE